MMNSTSIPEIMGPGFFIFFQVDPIGGGGQLKRNNISTASTIPEETRQENDEAIALSLILLCDENNRC